MTDYGTIKIPREDYERHNQRRQDLGLEWAEYLDGQAPDAPAWLDDLREELAHDVRNDTEGSDGIVYEDLVTACRTAIREELPDHLF